MKQFFICTLHHAIFETLYETIWNTSISSRLLTKKSETRLAMAFFKWLVLFQGNGWTSTGRNNWVCPISLKNCLKFQWCEEILCFSDFVVSWKSKKKNVQKLQNAPKNGPPLSGLYLAEGVHILIRFHWRWQVHRFACWKRYSEDF